MGIIQTIGGAIGGAVTRVRTFVTGTVRRPGISDVHDPGQTPTYYTPDLVSGGGGGSEYVTTSKLPSSEIPKEIQLQQTKQQLQAQGLTQHQRFLIAQAQRRQVTRRFYEENLARQRKAGLLPTKKFYEDRAKKQREAGALPTAEFYEKRAEQQRAREETLLTPEKPQAEVLSAGQFYSQFQKEQQANIFQKVQTTKVYKTIFTEEAKVIPLFLVKRRISIRETKEAFRSFGTGGKVAAEFVPSSIAEAGVLTAGAGLYGKLPSIARIGVSGTIAGFGIKGALTPSLPIEKRIASGIVGGLGLTGVATESVPFIRGAIVRVSPKYSPTKIQPKGFKAVELKKPIGLIPAKKGMVGVQLPKTSPLKKGAFGVKPSQKKLYLGKGQTLATSQRGLFKTGKEISLQKELYVTPQEPTLKIGETRISRLGLQEPFKVPKETRLGFGLPPKAQIGITKAPVGRIETPKQFKIGKGTELEAIKTYGIITKVQKKGVTTIKGQAVEIYTFKIGKGIPTGKVTKGFPSTDISTRVSGEAAISTGLVSAKVIKPTPSISIKTISKAPSPTITPRVSAPSFPTGRTPPSPVPPTTKPPSISTTPITKLITPKVPPSKPPATPPIFPPYKLPMPPQRPPRISFGRAKQKVPIESFTVFLRRFGKFKPIGKAPTARQAAEIGRLAAARTLGATFKVPEAKGLPTPKGFYKKISKKEGLIFIELPKFRLSMPTEIKEIQFAKRRKKFSLY